MHDVPAGSKTHIYGWVQGIVHADGKIDLVLHELGEQDLLAAKWPNAPVSAIHECYVNNMETPEK